MISKTHDALALAAATAETTKRVVVGGAKRGEGEERVEVRERGFVQRESAAVSSVDAAVAAVFSLERNRRGATEERGAAATAENRRDGDVFVAPTKERFSSLSSTSGANGDVSTRTRRKDSGLQRRRSARDETNVTAGIYEWNRYGVDDGEESSGCRYADGRE